MQLREYVRIVRRRGWIVVVMAVLTAAAAFGFSRLQTPVYEASVRLTMRPARADWGLGQAVSGVLRSLAGDITTHTFLQQVIDREQLDMTTDDLLNRRVFVRDEAADFTIAVTVRDPNERVAVQIVNAIAEIFIEKQQAWNDLQDRRDRFEVAVRDPARAAGIYSPKTTINVAAGVVLGGLIGVLIVAVLEWLGAGIVRSTDDMERLGVAALGAIPAESAWRR